MSQTANVLTDVRPAFSVNKLPGLFGVKVSGIDLNRDMTEAVLQNLVNLLHEHKVVVLTDQHLDDETYVRFGYFWGKPIDFFKDDHRGAKFKELIRVSNATTVPVEHRDGAVQWHSDSSYDEIPAYVTMLHCLEAPEAGGETLFADTIAAFAALPESEQAWLKDASAWHTMLGAPVIEGERTEGIKAPPWGTYLHRLAMPHPIDGRLALFTSATAQSIDGMPFEEGRARIRELRRHIAQTQFRQEYRLQPGDIMLWDNFSVAHSATPLEYSDAPGKRRVLQRISTKGLPAFLPDGA